MQIQFNTTKCKKCDGVGSITMYRGIDGGRCYACASKGVVTTRAGDAARTAYYAALSDAFATPAEAIKEGDRIQGNDRRIRTVRSISYNAVEKRLHVAFENTEVVWGVRHGEILRRVDRDTQVEVMREIAKRFPRSARITD